MENKVYMNSLLDFYGVLLTDKQRDVCSYYYGDDLSLQEIAENENVSRAAVYDIIKRCREELTSYEEKLHLYASWKKRDSLYKQIQKIGNKEINQLIAECIETEME